MIAFQTNSAMNDDKLTQALQTSKTATRLTSGSAGLDQQDRDRPEPDYEMNGLTVRVEYQRYLRLNSICLTMICFQTVLCFTYYQLDHMENRKPQLLLNCAYALHCLQVILRLVIEKIRSQRMQVIQKCDYSYGWEIAKILLSLPLYPLPWLHHSTMDVEYTQGLGHQALYPFKINYLLIIFAIFHSAMVGVNTLILNTVYYSPRAQRIGKIYQVQHHGAVYVVKCIIKDHPLSSFTLVSCIMWVFATVAIKILQADVPVDGNKFVYYQNCFWFIGITLATVGYGDIYPVSYLGHIMVCVCCVWSTFNISVITFLLVTNLSLSSHEHKSLQLLKNVDNTLTRKGLCGLYINIAVRRLWLNKKYRLNLIQTLQQKKLKTQAHVMRMAKRKCISINDLTEQMQIQFDKALINVNYLQENNKNIMDFIAKTFFVNNRSILYQKVRPSVDLCQKQSKSDEGQPTESSGLIKSSSASSEGEIADNTKTKDQQSKGHKISIEFEIKVNRKTVFRKRDAYATENGVDSQDAVVQG